LNEMAEEIFFYSNQCYDECRRVAKDNGDALIDHFMAHAQIKSDHVEKVSVSFVSEDCDLFGVLGV